MSAQDQAVVFTYLIALLILMFFVVFTIVFVWFYKKRQNQMILEQRIREEELKNEILIRELDKIKSIQEERERISHDLHDELGAGLSAIKLEAEFAIKYEKEIPRNLEQIRNYSQELTSAMREIVWSLNAGEDSLESLVFYIKEFADSFFSHTGVDFKIAIPVSIPDIAIGSLARKNLYLTVKEALNNIIKHSHANKAALNIDIENDRFRMEVEDDGTGIDFDKMHSGNGMITMQKRCEAIGAEIQINNLHPGCRIEIHYTLPGS